MSSKRKILLLTAGFLALVSVALALTMFGGKRPSMGTGNFSGRVEMELRRIGATNLPAQLQLAPAAFWHIHTDKEGFVLRAYGGNQAAINAVFTSIWGTPLINQTMTTSGLPMSVYSAQQANIGLQVIEEKHTIVLIGLRRLD